MEYIKEAIWFGPMIGMSFLLLHSLRFRRESEISGWFSALMLLLFTWTVGSYVELRADTFEWKLFGRNVQQIGVFLAPVIIYGLIRRLIGKPLGTASVFILLPFIGAIILIFTDQYHGWMRSSVRLEGTGEKVIEVVRTPLSTIILLSGLLLCVIGIIMLVIEAFRIGTAQKKNYLTFAFALVAISVLATFRLGSTYLADILPLSTLSFPFVLLLFNQAYRHQLLKVIPIARSVIVDHLKEPIMLLDGNSRIIDFNPAAERFLEKLGPLQIGISMLHFVNDFPVVKKAITSREKTTVGLEIEERVFEMQLIPLKAHAGMESALILMLSDRTSEVREEQLLRRLAETDSLTGLLNRRAFQDRVELSLDRGDGCGLILFDIDHFKQVNDKYGHQKGDEVICLVTRIVENVLDGSDAFSRIGGEEFGVLLSTQDQPSLLKKAETIRKSVESTTLESDVAITVSIGCGVLARGERFEKLYHRTDSALYEAKRNGRNQTIWAEHVLQNS